MSYRKNLCVGVVVVLVAAAMAQVTCAGFLDLTAATVTADSVYPGYETTWAATNVFDGVSNTRWVSNTTDQTHWISVDLGANYNLSEVAIDWADAKATDYTIAIRSAGGSV